ncbi:MAG TPA: hypothetical protein PL193_00770 [Xanthobacteraceae bacterium]|nr:hypothetical protein [Xanthobacteraceae bacterium]
MRSLIAARIVLLDSDQARRDALTAALAEFAAFEVESIATVAEVPSVAWTAPDVFIVEGPSRAANEEAGSISSNPFLASGIPTILLLPAATNEQRRRAIKAGYSVVLGAPVPPRLLYRRIAHLMQVTRRAKRRMAQAVTESTKPRVIEIAPAEPAPRAKVPAH